MNFFGFWPTLIILFLISVTGLLLGAYLTLKSAEKMGIALGLPPLLIGIFIIGFGTSLPEFVITQLAHTKGHSSLALGAIIGSNMANTFLMLGLVLTVRFLHYLHIALIIICL